MVNKKYKSIKIIGIIITVIIICIVAKIIKTTYTFLDTQVKEEAKSILQTEESIEETTIEEKKKEYDLTVQIKDLGLVTTEDYREYLEQIKKQIKPLELQNLMEITKDRIEYIMESYQNKTGEDLIRIYAYNTYFIVYERVIWPNGESWEGLPLSEHFKNKFNASEGAAVKDGKKSIGMVGYILGMIMKKILFQYYIF